MTWPSRRCPATKRRHRSGLDQLIAAGLMFQRGTPPDACYEFKHALVRDVAYSRLLRRPRRALHGRIAAYLQNRTPDQDDAEPEMLAWHFGEAGQPEQAAAYWLEAGRREAGRSANLEAIGHFRARHRCLVGAGGNAGTIATGAGAAARARPLPAGDPGLPERRAQDGLSARLEDRRAAGRRPRPVHGDVGSLAHQGPGKRERRDDGPSHRQAVLFGGHDRRQRPLPAGASRGLGAHAVARPTARHPSAT